MSEAATTVENKSSFLGKAAPFIVLLAGALAIKGCWEDDKSEVESSRNNAVFQLRQMGPLSNYSPSEATSIVRSVQAFCTSEGYVCEQPVLDPKTGIYSAKVDEKSLLSDVNDVVKQCPTLHGYGRYSFEEVCHTNLDELTNSLKRVSADHMNRLGH